MQNEYKVYLLPPVNLYKKYWLNVLIAYSALILDRTNTLTANDFGFRYKTITKIPEFTPYMQSFSDTCEKTTYNIVQLAETTDKKINIMWSGGIDSTVVLVSFLKHNTKRINVLLSQASILEYPLFFSRYIENNPNLSYTLVDKPEEHLSAVDLNITGELGDQVFGSAAIFKAYETGNLFKPYTDYMSEEFLLKLENQLKRCPIEITTVFDFLWWFNFSMKYQYVQLRLYPHVLLPYGCITHYFDNDDFQLWSMNNPDKKIRDSLCSYKYLAKDYIYEFTKDAEYRDNKLKENSLKLKKLKFSLDENFSCVKYLQGPYTNV